MGLKVLVVDDSSTMRKIISRSLATLEIQDPAEACTCDEAVTLFRAGGIDLILMDWNMPGKSGLEGVRQIRVFDTEIPIIMVTAEAEREQVLAAVEAGATDYLIKPFTNDGLRGKLEKYTGTSLARTVAS